MLHKNQKYPICKIQKSSYCLKLHWGSQYWLYFCNFHYGVSELSWIEMGLERFIWPLINQKLLWSSWTKSHIQFFGSLHYRWFRQSKHSRDSNGKILPCWLVSNTFRISSGTKTSASSFLKTFGESIFNDECENCLTSCDRCDLLVGCEVGTKFGFVIEKIKFLSSKFFK